MKKYFLAIAATFALLSVGGCASTAPKDCDETNKRPINKTQSITSPAAKAAATEKKE